VVLEPTGLLVALEAHLDQKAATTSARSRTIEARAAIQVGNTFLTSRASIDPGEAGHSCRTAPMKRDPRTRRREGRV
jgi:hypothetical protein